MSSGVNQVRQLVERGNGHPVISLYLDLDPERFATPPARSSQIRSLLDEGSRLVEGDAGLDHEERATLRSDLERVDTFLHSSRAPYQGSRALAVFCSGPSDLFEAIPLSRPVPGRVVVGRGAFVAPMFEVRQQRRWLVALVNRRDAWLLAGSPDRLREQARIADNVPGQHDQGGWSQARYERSVEKDVEDHLRRFAETVNERWRAERFQRLALGGPQETLPRFQELLGDELRAHLAPTRVDVDLSNATEAHIREAVEAVVEEDDRLYEKKTLERVGEGLGVERATQGVSDTVDALNQRRVGQLLIDPAFDGEGYRCPSCGLLVLEPGQCPADGTGIERLEHLREALIEAAIVQDAEVVVLRHHDDLRERGVASLLRF